MTKPKDSVLRDLYACFLTNKTVPKDLSDAFVERYLRGRNGEVGSWDEVFGKPTRYGTGENIKRKIKQGQLVADEVDRLKASVSSTTARRIGHHLLVEKRRKSTPLLQVNSAP